MTGPHELLCMIRDTLLTNGIMYVTMNMNE